MLSATVTGSPAVSSKKVVKAGSVTAPRQRDDRTLDREGVGRLQQRHCMAECSGLTQLPFLASGMAERLAGVSIVTGSSTLARSTSSPYSTSSDSI